MIPDFHPKIAHSLGTRLKATLDGIDWIIMELGKCVVENQSEGFGISTSTPAAAVDSLKMGLATGLATFS